MKILNTIGGIYTKDAKIILNKLGRVDYLEIKNQIHLEEIIDEYDVAVIGLGLNFDKKVIDAGKNLKIIATASTGTDHIDINYAEKRGIKVLSLKNDRNFLDTITGTAELAFLLLLALSRNILPATSSVLNYCWSEKFRGHNLYKKTLGIVGLGRLGNMMAKYGKAFGMEIIAFDPYLDEKYFLKNKYKKVSLKDLLKKSDVISIHVHLNKETENMFNEKIFKLMPKKPIIINTSRGKIVNERDLLKALKSKKISGYGTDVLADELEFNKKFENNKLIEYARESNNIIITPHVGGVTFESREATDIFIAKKVRNEIIKLK
jgi:D-3-phosphoglycerate dehydrogenase